MKKILSILLVLIALVLIGLNYLGFFGSEENIRQAKNMPAVEKFKEIQLDFVHAAHPDRFAFSGAAVIDVDDNGTMEVFLSGSQDQSNGLFEYKDGALVDISQQVGLAHTEATYGAAALDMDNDNDTDLLLAQDSGVWLYSNNNGHFTGQTIYPTTVADSFPVTIGLADLNHDGLADLYISNFVSANKFAPSTFNDPNHIRYNVMLLNKGNAIFEDITHKTGTAGVQNTFHAAFVDLDNNGEQDLILANNTGPVEIFKNKGNLEFEPLDLKSGLGYWMGLAVGDIDKDGDQDLFFSNIGASIPNALVRGDLKEDQDLKLDWLLLENSGNHQLSDITANYELTDYGFAWGAVFEDINLDGELDLLVAQNYINWPPHQTNKLAGKAFTQLSENDKKGFYQIDELGLDNPYYGQSPLIVDLNTDGKPDLIWLNMNGPARAFINQSQNNYLKVSVPDTAQSLGATLFLETTSGQSYSKQIMANIGFASDQTPNVFFGLGKLNNIISLTITMANGEQREIANPAINSTIILN